jgi:alpha-L-fucosidase 2
MLPPMQVDGNFGITAAICEMLVQSQEGDINLLPALPREWAAGSMSGLRARGDFVVSLKWADGKLASATIHSLSGNPCRVRYGNIVKDLEIGRNESVILDDRLMPVN